MYLLINLGPFSHALPCFCMQYYDDAAGILRSIILSAIAPHRLSLPTMPMPAFSITPDQAINLLLLNSDLHLQGHWCIFYALRATHCFLLAALQAFLQASWTSLQQTLCLGIRCNSWSCFRS